MIGDSTMANKTLDNDNQERGWGMVLQPYFTDDVIVENHAVNGRSSKSFINEGRWKVVLDRIKPGDYVFIQFGHNDEKPSPDRHTDPGSTFDENLSKFVRETLERGGVPVLFNSVVRRNFYLQTDSSVDDESLRDKKYADFDEKINSDTLVDTHGQYIISPRVVASKLQVPFVDANKLTHDIEQNLGVAGSRKLHMWFKPGEHPSIPAGRKDNTHYSVYGAHVVAGLLIDEIGRNVPSLTPYIRHYDMTVCKDGSGHFMHLQDAVDLASKGFVPSPLGKGNVKAGNRITIYVGAETWKKPAKALSENIELILHKDAIIK